MVVRSSLALTAATNGAVADLEAQQLAGIKSQVVQQNGTVDIAAFEGAHFLLLK